MVIGVQHAARGETFDRAQFLNPQQNQRRPDIIERIEREEQNPEQDFVLRTPSCESNTIMSNKHRAIIVGRLFQTPNFFRYVPVQYSEDLTGEVTEYTKNDLVPRLARSPCAARE